MLALAACMASASPTLAGNTLDTQWQDQDSIRTAAVEFVEQEMAGTAEVSARAGYVDNRLRLRRCEHDLEAFLPSGRSLDKGTATIGVRCPGPVQWRLFVSVHLEVRSPVVVLTASVRRREVLTAEHVALRERDTAGIRRGYYSQPDEVLGMRLRRNLGPGSILHPGHLETRRLVQRGQRLRLVANGDAVRVSMAGEALENGAKGKRIRVRNLSSGRELEGVVAGEGVVEIRF
mgnify:CR=1 FL=1